MIVSARIDKTMDEFQNQSRAKREKIMVMQQKLQQEGFKRNRPGPPI